MAKRFFNTSRIDEDWYLELSLKHRELLRFCESKCDGAGVFCFSGKIASLYIGEKVTEADLEKIRAEKLTNGKFWLPEFIEEQNSELKENCPAHKPIFKSIKENGLTLSNRVSERVCNTQQEIEKEVVIEKDKEIEKETDKEKGGEKFEIVYPFDSEEFRAGWQFWLDYKRKEHRFSYKSPETEQIALKELSELSGNSEDVALKIIQTSITNGWKGLFKPKENGNSKTIPINRGKQPDLSYRNAENYR